MSIPEELLANLPIEILRGVAVNLTVQVEKGAIVHKKL